MSEVPVCDTCVLSQICVIGTSDLSQAPFKVQVETRLSWDTSIVILEPGNLHVVMYMYEVYYRA